MLLPDNIHPELSIYYNGALVLKELQSNVVQPIIELYQAIREKYDMSFPVFLLSLDWLYLIGATKSNDKGEIELCL